MLFEESKVARAKDSKEIETPVHCDRSVIERTSLLFCWHFQTENVRLDRSYAELKFQIDTRAPDGGELEENNWSCLGFVSIDVLEVEPFT